jgi:cytochrome c556
VSQKVRLRSMGIKIWMVTAIFLVVAGSFSFAHEGASGVVKERMERFKTSQIGLREIVKFVKQAEFDQVKTRAESLTRWGDEMPDYFPADSNPKPSEAADRIWQDFADFTLRAEAFSEASKGLALAAQKADQKATLNAAMAVAQSCKACHQAYRN